MRQVVGRCTGPYRRTFRPQATPVPETGGFQRRARQGWPPALSAVMAGVLSAIWPPCACRCCRVGRAGGHTAPVTRPTDPAHDQVSAPTEHAQPGVASRPRLTLSAAAEACAVSRSTLRRRLAQGAFPHAAQGTSGAWTVPIGDLLAAGLRVHAPQVAGAQAPPVVSKGSGPVHRPPAGA